MAGSDPNLGICFSDKQLYFAINDIETPGRLKRIGCFDFNFSFAKAIHNQESDALDGVYDLIGRLKEEFNFGQIRMLTVPDTECWATVPKLVHDKSDEREAYLKILMKGVRRSILEPLWYELSNANYRFLVVRNKNILDSYIHLTEHASSAEFCSDFEIGSHWVRHSNSKGSFLTISCYKRMLSISSYMLGKLRAATYLRFDRLDDLPYLWLHQSENLKWLNGYNDEILVYGKDSEKVIKQLRTVWKNEASLEIQKVDTLDKMHVSADDETYGFRLDSAFPAIMLALDP